MLEKNLARHLGELNIGLSGVAEHEPKCVNSTVNAVNGDVRNLRNFCGRATAILNDSNGKAIKNKSVRAKLKFPAVCHFVFMIHFSMGCVKRFSFNCD
jgi:hypothetical protein